MSIFDFFKKKKGDKNDFVDENGNVTKSAIAYNKMNERFLRMKDSDCGIVLHDDNNVEVIFTKAYDMENQTITPNEETLMAIALFMKQPGFLDMIIDEFRKIARERIKVLTEDDKEKESK